MILGEKISILRKQNGWSQEELAEKLNISRQSVSKWESSTSIPDLDKIIKLSAIFDVSTDYLLKDELEKITPSETDTNYDNQNNIRSLSLEEANTYMNVIEQVAKHMAAAVALCILSPVCIILFGGLSEYTTTQRQSPIMTENMAGGFGTTILLLLIAIAVATFIINGLKISKYDYLEKEPFTLQYGVQGIIEKKKTLFEKKFQGSIAIGVVLCIIGIVPMMLAAAIDASEIVYICCTALLLIFIASGVTLFVWAGMIHGSYCKLLQSGEFSLENKEFSKKTEFFPGIYWCIVTAAYLFISFYFNCWDKSWIIWPVTGALFAAISGILKTIMKNKN